MNILVTGGVGFIGGHLAESFVNEGHDITTLDIFEPFYGDGTQIRDFTYIADVVDANHSLLTDDSADGEAMNIGSTDNIDTTTLAEVVRDEIDPTLDIEYTEARDGDAEHTHADISKANELIGYEPSRDIREGVSEFIEWYDQNHEWYEPLVVNS